MENVLNSNRLKKCLEFFSISLFVFFTFYVIAFFVFMKKLDKWLA